MNRFWGRTVSTAAVAAAAAASIPACAHNDQTLYVQFALAPPTPTNGQCTYDPVVTSPFLPRGTVDAALTPGYTPVFLLGNTNRSQGSLDNVQAETGRILVQGALVRVIDPADGSVWMDNTVLTTGTIEPAAGTTSSYMAIPATIMDAKALAHFDPGKGQPAKLAVTYVTFYGQSTGGDSIESNEFQFPVDVCHGCLVSYPALDTNTLQQYCSGKISSTSTTGGVACVTGQDQVVDCQHCFAIAPDVCSGH
jgi:hypothetical protein